MLDMLEESAYDHKILAVPVSGPRFKEVQRLGDIREHIRIEVQHFFEIYKELEGNAVELKGWKDVDEAQAAIRQSR